MLFLIPGLLLFGIIEFCLSSETFCVVLLLGGFWGVGGALGFEEKCRLK